MMRWAVAMRTVKPSARAFEKDFNKGRIILHEDTDTILGQYGILKVSEDEYAAMDKQYVIAEKKDKFSHTCLTKEKQFYLDNYPNMVVENSSIDDMIVLMLGGKEK